MLIVGAGVGSGSAVLTSGSTRRRGIVLNTDFAPYVCSYFGIEPAPDFVGTPFEFIPLSNTHKYIRDVFRRDSFVENRYGMLKNVVLWHLAMLIVCFAAAMFVAKVGKSLRHILSGLLIGTSCMFISFLFAAGIPYEKGPAFFIVGYFALCIVLAGAASLMPGSRHKYMFVAAVYFLSLAADQLTGGELIMNSALGYYPQSGARFYGIGNEFMGFMISAPVVFIGLAMDAAPRLSRLLKFVACIIFLACVYIVGSPALGANLGGLISCSVAYIFMILLIYQGRLNWRSVLPALFAAAIFVGVFIGVDVLLTDNNSHVTRLVLRVAGDGGMPELLKVVGRKLAVNLRLIKASFWSAIFIISLVFAFAAHYFPVNRLRRLFEINPNFKHAYAASLLGALVAFAVNDSGIVPGATAFIIPTAALFHILFNMEKENDEPDIQYDEI